MILPDSALMVEAKPAERQEWKRYWPLVLACSVGFSFNSVMPAAAGVFMQPLGHEFHWNRAMQSSGLSITAVVAFVLAPLFGWLIDKVGTRRLALPGVVLSAISITAFGYTTGSVGQWVIMWSIFALEAVAIKSTVWTVAVSNVFDAGRGMAIGVTLAGTAVAQIITPPLANYLIDHFGWRNAFAWFGLGWGGLSLVLCWLFLFDAHDVARRQQGKQVDLAERAAKQALLPGLTIPQAWRNMALWRIAISAFIMMFITIALWRLAQFWCDLWHHSDAYRGGIGGWPYVAGLVYDACHGYAPFLYLGVAGSLISGWLIFGMEPEPLWECMTEDKLV